MSFADVTSANVVGYQQVTIPAQEYTMIGSVFNGTGNDEGISVQDLIPNPLGQGLTGATGSANADQLMYWDPDEANSYVTLYLNSNTGTTDLMKNRHNRWCTTRVQNDKSWGTVNNSASTKIVPPGMGFWLKRKTYTDAKSITLSGQVVVASDMTKAVTIREGYNMMTMPFTQAFAPNPDVAGVGPAVDWLSKGCVGATGSANADQLMYWDPTEANSYVTLYLNSNTGTTDLMKNRHNHWCTTRVQNDKSWGTVNNSATAKVIPSGRAVFYNRKTGAGAFTLTFDQPYTLGK